MFSLSVMPLIGQYVLKFVVLRLWQPLMHVTGAIDTMINGTRG